ncbi:hypothetical protein Glove_318g26 [Diversispora epigaea]|uniref:BTB domain-containing protein n=1 Tax=Diversispora epigaea TaxID=1348612 RepID=A0A397HQ35_9GLOM|nr:hypothetical protein Glove_318g26 [Diversispora epigaea]
MELKFFDKLSQNFIELLDDGDDYNVIIEVENKTFTAHSNVLKCRSPFFRRELKTIAPNKNNIKTIIKSSISAQIFNVILKYIYGGIINLKNDGFILMLVANEFELEELINKLETHLIFARASWLKGNFSLVYRTIFDRQNFKKLKNFCNDIAAKYPKLIFDDSDFTSLQESALKSKFGIMSSSGEFLKNSTLPTNLEEWTKENFLTLKTSLQQCLSYIRYFHLSADEVLDSIKPYKKILDKQLWEDIIQHLLSPKRLLKPIILPARSLLVTEPKEHFSTIISEDHAAEISTWIDRKIINYLTTNNPYKFELILRGTRDGFTPQKFWDNGHGHAGTVVVMKVKGNDEILGGYNPLAWSKNGNSILSRVKNPQWAIINRCKGSQKYYGPQFGIDFQMHSPSSDFILDNQCYCRNFGAFYEKSIRTSLSGCFSITNYEVFKVIKKTT